MDDKENRLPMSERVDDLIEEVRGPKNARISTGFPSLDRALNGGVPYFCTLIVLTVNPKCFHEEEFAVQLADQLAENGMFVWISSSVLSEDVIVKTSILRISCDYFIQNNINSFIKHDKTPTYEERLDNGISWYKCFCDNILINGRGSSVKMMEDLSSQALKLKLRAERQGKRLFIVIDPLQTFRMHNVETYRDDPDEIMYNRLIMIRDFAVHHNIPIFVINTDPRDRIERISDVHFTLDLKGRHNGQSYIFKDSDICITKSTFN